MYTFCALRGQLKHHHSAANFYCSSRFDLQAISAGFGLGQIYAILCTEYMSNSLRQTASLSLLAWLKENYTFLSRYVLIVLAEIECATVLYFS